MKEFVQRTLNPAWYHGHGKRAPFFEGWYYKLVNAAEDKRFAIIPGVFIHKNAAESHAFIQVLDGMAGKATYHSYPTVDASKNSFDLRIGGNRFQLEQIDLDIDDEHAQIQGTLRFHSLKAWHISPLYVGYMGWFAWLPFLECYHGVLSFDHAISGTLRINGETIDFTGGRGYIEKDWGKNFPKGYVWLQTNHFDAQDTSLTGAIAVVPMLGFKIAGFAIALWHKGKLYPFATYNGAKTSRFAVTDTTVAWTVYTAKHELVVQAERADGAFLKSPERVAMITRVDETLKASAHVTLNRLDGTRKYTLFEGKGRNMGLEVIGDLRMLLK